MKTAFIAPVNVKRMFIVKIDLERSLKVTIGPENQHNYCIKMF